eukprot:12624956-Ditylum_brightwellii.AAC.1
MDAITQVIKGQDIQDGDAAYLLVKSLLRGPTSLQERRGQSGSVTEHIFSKKVYKTQKKYLWNIRKPLRLGLREWISQMIKLNNYLEFFPVPDGVTAETITREEFVDVLEDEVPYQWKLEFEKE